MIRDFLTAAFNVRSVETESAQILISEDKRDRGFVLFGKAINCGLMAVRYDMRCMRVTGSVSF
jgi:hypothetical protein